MTGSQCVVQKIPKIPREFMQRLDGYVGNTATGKLRTGTPVPRFRPLLDPSSSPPQGLGFAPRRAAAAGAGRGAAGPARRRGGVRRYVVSNSKLEQILL